MHILTILVDLSHDGEILREDADLGLLSSFPRLIL